MPYVNGTVKGLSGILNQDQGESLGWTLLLGQGEWFGWASEATQMGYILACYTEANYMQVHFGTCSTRNTNIFMPSSQLRKTLCAGLLLPEHELKLGFSQLCV